MAKKANGLRQTDRLTKWFLVLHFAAKNSGPNQKRNKIKQKMMKQIIFDDPVVPTVATKCQCNCLITYSIIFGNHPTNTHTTLQYYL